MAVADVFDIEKKKVAQVELNDAVFSAELNEAVVYDVVKMQMAARRSGTCSRWRKKAVAAKRNRSGPRGNNKITHLAGRRNRFWSSSTRLLLQCAEKGAEKSINICTEHEAQRR